MTETAILLAGGLFRTPFAKTTHGLVRGPSRYRVLGVVDPECAGEDAGELLDGRRRDVPIRASLREFLGGGVRPTHCVVGVATEGGAIPPGLRADLLAAARAGLSLVNGLHQLLADDAELARLTEAAGGAILDLRRPRPVAELAFWTGEILALTTSRIAVLGTDCAVGKRTTCTLLRDALREHGARAEMVYTGQTGWMQGIEHGFLFDATPNDFVPGELERAILACARASEPDVILIEGQSALRNPSGPAGAELLLSGGARGVVLQHAPAREFYEGFEAQGCRIGSLSEELELVRLYGGEVWALTLYEAGLDDPEAQRARLEHELDVPVVLPLRDAERLADVVLARLAGEPRA